MVAIPRPPDSSSAAMVPGPQREMGGLAVVAASLPRDLQPKRYVVACNCLQVNRTLGPRTCGKGRQRTSDEELTSRAICAQETYVRAEVGEHFASNGRNGRVGADGSYFLRSGTLLTRFAEQNLLFSCHLHLFTRVVEIHVRLRMRNLLAV